LRAARITGPAGTGVLEYAGPRISKWHGVQVIRRHIAINGELGSGKSSVARRLAEAYGMRLVSTGDVQRAMAESFRMTTLETNLLAEQDAMIDARVDGVTRDLGSSQDPIVFDSRMAWKMVPVAFKVRLIVDTQIAAVRLYKERSSTVEGYSSVDEARKAARERYQSESKRFLAKYGVDISYLQNYDLVIDTSDASIDDVASEIRSIYEADLAPRLELRVSPWRVLPGYDPAREPAAIRVPEHEWRAPLPGAEPYPVVAYARPFVYALDGLRWISQGIRSGQSLMKATLRAEDAQVAAQGMSAEEYLRKAVRRDWIAQWEQEQGIRFSRYP